MKKIIFSLVLLINAVFINLSGQDVQFSSNDYIDTLKDHIINEKHSYLDANFMEESSLLKLGLSPFKFSLSDDILDAEINGMLIFEKKLKPSWSIITNLNIMYTGLFSRTGAWGYFSNDIGVRYYYNMKKRMRNASGANNFNSNYFSIVVKKWTECTFGKEPQVHYANGWNFAPDYLISWGIQRRFGKWGFIDLGPYISYSREFYESPRVRSLAFGVNFKFGLAHGWK